MMRRFSIRQSVAPATRVVHLLVAVLALQVIAGPGLVAQAAPSTPVPFVFHVFARPQDGGGLIATTVTSETFRPSDVSTGTWVTYRGLFVPGGNNTVNSSGLLTARHSSAGLVAEVTQLVGTKGYGSLVVDAVVGRGELAYTTQGGVRGTVHFATAPTGINEFAVQLLDPVPPIFFTN
jgi:hypothetical protein